MKKFILILAAIVIIAGLLIGTNIATGAPTTSPSSPTVVVLNPIVKLDRASTITIMGSGFKSKQELGLLLKLPDGVTTDMYSYVSPEPIANDVGAFAVVFSPGEFIRRKMVAQGVYNLVITDTDYNVLTTVPFGFYDPAAPDKWPTWVKANVAAPAPAK